MKKCVQIVFYSFLSSTVHEDAAAYTITMHAASYMNMLFYLENENALFRHI